MSQYSVARERSDGSGKINYPPELPRDRQNVAQKWIILSIITILSVGASPVWYSKGIFLAAGYMCIASACGVLMVALAQLIYRLCLWSEEIHHIPSRYPDLKTTVIHAFDMNLATKCSILTSIVLLLLVMVAGLDNPFVMLWRMGALPTIAVTISVTISAVLFSYLIHMDESILNTALQIERLSSLDYGSGMAYNFFYGYLRLVLSVPEIGNDPKSGITGRIETYINKERLWKEEDLDYTPFPVKKLFILIPKNLYVPTDLKEASCDGPYDATKCWMEAVKSLEGQELDRAGVKKRVYKNSVYKIRDPDAAPAERPVYVVAEGATPLKTLFDVIDMNPKMSAVFKKHREEIVSAFYKALLEILRESEDCRDLCEVIYYTDKDRNNRKVNVAKIILERIEELKRRQ